MDELKALPQRKLTATFECGGNGASKGFMDAVHNSEFVETSVSRMPTKSVIARVMRKPDVDGKVPIKAYGAVWSDGTPIKNEHDRRQPVGG